MHLSLIFDAPVACTSRRSKEAAVSGLWNRAISKKRFRRFDPSQWNVVHGPWVMRSY